MLDTFQVSFRNWFELNDINLYKEVFNYRVSYYDTMNIILYLFNIIFQSLKKATNW